MTRLLLLAAVLAALPAASAQTDPGGASAPLPAAVTVNDSDPGGLSEALPAPSTVSDTDADAPTGVVSSRPAAAETTSMDGRDPSAPAATLRVESVADERAAPLADGRDPDAEIVADARGPVSNGPLPNGREGGDASALADADPVAEASSKTDMLPVGLSLSTVMPNPVRSRAAVTFSVEAESAATVTVYDLTGRRVAVAYDDVARAGVETRVELDLGGLAAGTYVAVLDTGRARLSETFQVVR